ncbi:MAG: peptidyl-prolyl cis-trans isomerase [Acidobacteria bacterium]|nr:peptidyl-prolyl cis-trans isomerase [Acidobacteriota bacterium]
MIGRGSYPLIAWALLFTTSGGAAQEKKEKNPVVIMETSLGSIKIELFEGKAPTSVKNFLDYANSGFYEGTIFHRVIPDFMIQGGGLTADMVRKPTRPSIKNEATNGLSNTRGTIAMARTPEIDSASSQFFINVKDNKGLDYRDKTPDGFGYAVFGRVVEGMDVVDKIRYVKTGMKAGNQNVPLETIVIKSVKLAAP